MLRHFQAAGNAAVVPLLHKVQPFLFGCDRFLHDVIFGVEFAQREVVRSEFRGQNELYVAKIGGRGLQSGICCFDLTPHASEKIGFVAQRKRNAINALRVWSDGLYDSVDNLRRRAIQRTIP